MTTTKTIAARIAEALYIRGMKQADLVEKTGIGKSSISTYLSGEYEPKQKNIYKIAKALDVNEAWLMGHDVPMDRKLTTTELFTGKFNVTVLEPKEEVIINKYRLLDEKGKHAVKSMLQMEYERCTRPVLNAAHALEGSSVEDAKHDDDIMDDENF